MKSASGQEMVWGHVSLCLIITIVVVNASVSMLVGAVRNDHKHAGRELMQNIPGFISIDCGLSMGSPGYIYQETGIGYVPDEGFTETGKNKNINTMVDETIEPYLKNVRSFPEGKRNCYTLKPKAGRNNTYLVRATFLYGNYDFQSSPPAFDLHLGTDLWTSVTFSTNYTRVVRHEIIYIPTTDYLDVCLVNTNKGVPFISALELRLLNNDLYKTESGSSLQSWVRNDYGGDTTQPPIRYQDDVYDRLWFPVETPDLVAVETKLTMDALSNNDYKPPPVVMRTAVRSTNNNGSVVLSWKPTDATSGYYVYMHFFEVDSTVRVSRQFSIDVNGIPWFTAVNLPVGKLLTLFTTTALKGVEFNLTIAPTNISTFPPLLNAVEIYIEKKLQKLHTQLEDVDAMMNIKNSYKIISNWQGDPCLSEDYLWEGLKCNHDQNMSIIISLNMTQRELTGEVAHSISNLKSLESLDLSYNNLSGKIPAFLADMPSLKVLNLAGNNFTGSIPQSLLSKNGSTLTLSVGENPYLCVSHCGTKKSSKKKYIVPASIISVLVLVVSVGAFIFWKSRRKGSQEMAIEITKEVVLSAVESTKVPLVSKTQSFTYSEIISITNNFETSLGKGASGEVYRGYLKDQGREVAVKILTASSTESARLFQTEVELLWRIHHNCLVSFLGYCNDGTNMAVIYEFMASGSLKKNLSEENPKILTWKERLQIAVDAAQGLEYLHKYCTPSIVHRDLKSDNILLDKNLRAKISDFGISIIFEAESRTHISAENIAGTIGYLDPEYHSTGKLSEKSDVYSFGIVLLELITGQSVVIKDTEGTEQFIHIIKWIEPLLKKRDIHDIIDSRLQGNFGMDSAPKVIEIAMECVPETARPRPYMAAVLAKLKECLALELRDDSACGVDHGDDKGTSRLIKRATM